MSDRAFRTAYLVVEPNPLLRADLAETLEDRDAEAAVIAVATAQDALARLVALQALRLALVAAGPDDFGGSALAQMIKAKGGSVVLMGDRAEAYGEAAGYRVLQRPFSPPHVLGLLDG